MDQFGVASIPCGIFPTEIFLHSKKRIQTLEDFKGVKLRTAGAWAEIAGGLGASTVILPGAEVYPALERGVIDATEWSSPSVNVPSGFHKIAKYVIMPGVHQPGATQECVFNVDAWNRISEGDRELLKLAGKLGVLDSWARYAYKDIAALKEFDKAGNELVLLDDEFVSTANEAAQRVGRRPRRRRTSGSSAPSTIGWLSRRTWRTGRSSASRSASARRRERQAPHAEPLRGPRSRRSGGIVVGRTGSPGGRSHRGPGRRSSSCRRGARRAGTEPRPAEGRAVKARRAASRGGPRRPVREHEEERTGMRGNDRCLT